MLYTFLPNKLFWSFVLCYNKTKMVVIGVPIGVSKLKITEERKICPYFMAQEKCGA